MKNKDSVFYIVCILSFALLVLSPIITDGVFAQDSPITNIFSTWLTHGENFTNARVFATGY